jgi:hypothetical protein
MGRDVKLTPFAKALITIIALCAVALTVNSQRNRSVAGKRQPQASSMPRKVHLVDTSAIAKRSPVTLDTRRGCTDKPEIRLYHGAWNAQMGMMYATGGKQAAVGSLMCKHGVNLKLIREDDTKNMQTQLMSFAEELKAGTKNPANGAHFIVIMGDGGAAFFKAINDRLDKLGTDYEVEVVGSAGYSRGEDKLMGPKAWKDNPQTARGSLVAGVLRGGDWNIAMKWLGDNNIPNNPDETTFDPDAMNWVNASDYLDAASKYISGFCVDRKNKKTGSKEQHCVQGIVTSTPGDVNAAEQKGGLVSIVSTKEYRSQMPAVIIGSKKWINDNRELVKNMLAAIFEGAEAVKDEANLRQAAAVSALVYDAKDGDYWFKYFTPQVVKDKTGAPVDLGGSAVSNLADNLQLFGLAPGSANDVRQARELAVSRPRAEVPALGKDRRCLADQRACRAGRAEDCARSRYVRCVQERQAGRGCGQPQELEHPVRDRHGDLLGQCGRSAQAAAR